MQYDPLTAPQREGWLAAAEAERLDAVLRYHKESGTRAQNLKLHAALHATVETQLAQRYSGVQQTLERLVAEGASRHQAIHAIGTVVAERLSHVLKGERFDEQAYQRELAALDADAWRKSGEAAPHEG